MYTFWISHYSDNTSLPQFDPYDFHENAFKDIEQDKLIKFGLYPFTKELADGVRKAGTASVAVPFLPKYEINLDKDKRLICYRDIFISHEDYHLCKKCNREYTFESTSPMIRGKYPSPICPHCGAHDIFVCKSCSKKHETFEDTSNGMCGCKGHTEYIKYTSGQNSREKRWIHYYLGYQTLVRGSNHKMLMRIFENGDAEIL